MTKNVKDYYKILGVRETASAEEIRDQWVKLMKKFHPDLPGKSPEDERAVMEINEAYHVLKDSLTRMEYDLERSQERTSRKFSVPKMVFPILGVVFFLFLFLVDFKKPNIPPHQPNGVTTRDPMTQRRNDATTPQPNAPMTQREAKVQVEKPHQPNDVTTRDSMTQRPNDAMTQSDPMTQIGTQQRSAPKSQVTLLNQTSQTNPRNQRNRLITEKEVRQFLTGYVERYIQRDVDGFLSFFSSRAMQNQKHELQDIREIYSSFFMQSQKLRYRMEDVKIEIYEKAVTVRARYEVDQILEKSGEKKNWKGNILWGLEKENGILKIVTLDYEY